MLGLAISDIEAILRESGLLSKGTVFPTLFGNVVSREKRRESALFPDRSEGRLSDDCRTASTFDDVAEHRQPGSDPAVVRADRHEFALMGVETAASHPDFPSLK